MAQIIPIFPLKLVLFPGSVFALHIFEERYKKMINQCIRDGSGFGVFLEGDELIGESGTYTTVKRILNDYDDGRKDIIVTGNHRIHLIDFNRHSDGYFIAEVSIFDDIENELDTGLLSQVSDTLKSLVERLKFNVGLRYYERLKKSEKPSFVIAEKAGLELEDRLKVLKMRSENQRLLFLQRHLDEIESLLSATEKKQTVEWNDGYLDPTTLL